MTPTAFGDSALPHRPFRDGNGPNHPTARGIAFSKHLGIISPAYAVYRQHKAKRLLSDFADHLLRITPYKLNYLSRSTGLRASRLRLYPDEFFKIPIIVPPLIFINGADFKAAQMFTVAHELAHLWIGKDGVSNFDALQPHPNEVEKWCNAVAAEFLVPAHELRAVWPQARSAAEPYQFLAGRFKVSALVAARRVLDLALASRDEFFDFFRAYQEDERRWQKLKPSGGNFWATQNVRIGRRFGAAVVKSAREGKLLYREAYSLTGLSGRTFDRFSEKLGFQPR